MKLKALSLLLALSPLCLSAQTALPYGQPEISVNGHAERMIAPDIMQWSVQVRTEGSAVSDVADGQRKNVSSVLDFLKTAGLPEKKVQTTHMQLQENWEYRNGSRYKNGYYAETTVLFESKDLGLYDKIWQGLSELKGVSVNNVTLTLDDPVAVRDEVRIDALKSARAKAEAMAAALDCSIGDVLSVSEVGSGSVQPMANVRMMTMEAKGASDSSSISPGEVEVDADVQVVFGLLNKR